MVCTNWTTVEHAHVTNFTNMSDIADSTTIAPHVNETIIPPKQVKRVLHFTYTWNVDKEIAQFFINGKLAFETPLIQPLYENEKQFLVPAHNDSAIFDNLETDDEDKATSDKLRKLEILDKSNKHAEKVTA